MVTKCAYACNFCRVATRKTHGKYQICQMTTGFLKWNLAYTKWQICRRNCGPTIPNRCCPLSYCYYRHIYEWMLRLYRPRRVICSTLLSLRGIYSSIFTNCLEVRWCFFRKTLSRGFTEKNRLCSSVIISVVLCSCRQRKKEKRLWNWFFGSMEEWGSSSKNNNKR